MSRHRVGRECDRDSDVVISSCVLKAFGYPVEIVDERTRIGWMKNLTADHPRRSMRRMEESDPVNFWTPSGWKLVRN